MGGNPYPHLIIPKEDWLARYTEEALEPELAIVDAHHHLWDIPGWRYLADEFRADLASGHSIRASVFVQASSMYREYGPSEFRPVGETEFVNGVAAMGAAGWCGETLLCAGIVGFVDLRQGTHVAPVLEAHIRAGCGRFRGVRFVSNWDDDASITNPLHPVGPRLLEDPTFREAFGCLAPLGLSFDATCYHTQLPEVTDLARAYPETTIILDHVGSPIGIGKYTGRTDEVFAAWKSAIRDLAHCSNVYVKLGGLGNHISGFRVFDRPSPPSSEALAALWKPYIETCIEAFGPDRAMFESNFPVDRISCTYAVMWNALKRLASGCSEETKSRLFRETAIEAYRLDHVSI